MNKTKSESAFRWGRLHFAHLFSLFYAILHLFFALGRLNVRWSQQESSQQLVKVAKQNLLEYNKPLKL